MSQPPLVINPWLTIWTQPRRTIRDIVEMDPNHRLGVLIALAGLGYLIGYALPVEEPYTMPILQGLINLPLQLFIHFQVHSAVLVWLGRRSGSRATLPEIRAAIAWSEIPSFILLLPASLAFLTLSPELLTLNSEVTSTFMFRFLGLSIALMVLGIWAFTIYLRCLSEVLSFSLWRSFGLWILSLVVIIPLTWIISWLIEKLV